MSIEIERKFHVINSSYRSLAIAKIDISQAYLCTDPDATVRLRIFGEHASITIKGRSVGACRGEWEYQIPLQDALDMLTACCGNRKLEKTRYIVDAGNGLRWEIDEFHGRHEGLVIAEIELPAEDTSFDKPLFIGDEVTGDTRYYNSNLCKS